MIFFHCYCSVLIDILYSTVGITSYIFCFYYLFIYLFWAFLICRFCRCDTLFGAHAMLARCSCSCRADAPGADAHVVLISCSGGACAMLMAMPCWGYIRDCIAPVLILFSCGVGDRVVHMLSSYECRVRVVLVLC